MCPFYKDVPKVAETSIEIWQMLALRNFKEFGCDYTA